MRVVIEVPWCLGRVVSKKLSRLNDKFLGRHKRSNIGVAKPWKLKINTLTCLGVVLWCSKRKHFPRWTARHLPRSSRSPSTTKSLLKLPTHQNRLPVSKGTNLTPLSCFPPSPHGDLTCLTHKFRQPTRPFRHVHKERRLLTTMSSRCS